MKDATVRTLDVDAEAVVADAWIDLEDGDVEPHLEQRARGAHAGLTTPDNADRGHAFLPCSRQAPDFPLPMRDSSFVVSLRKPQTRGPAGSVRTMTDGEVLRGRGFVERHAWAPYLLLTLAMLFMGSNVVVGRAIHETIPPMGLTFWRCLVAVALLAPLVAGQLRTQARVAVRHWRLMLFLGLTWAITGHALVLLGLHTTTAVNAGVMTATQPALTMVVAWLLLRHAVASQQLLGVAVALVGVVTIIARGEVGTLLGLDFVIGDLWVQLSMLSFAFYNTVVRRAPHGLNAFVLFLATSVAATLILLPFYVAEMVLFDAYVTFDATMAATVLYMAVFASILGSALMTMGIKQIGPGKSAAFTSLIPVFTAILAVAFLGETLQLYHFIGITFVLGGVYLISRGPTPGMSPSAANGGTT
jgi:drug/metabolite transporter (DMT)-like permease